MPIDGFSIRQTLLQVCEEYAKIGPGYFQSGHEGDRQTPGHSLP